MVAPLHEEHARAARACMSRLCAALGEDERVCGEPRQPADRKHVVSLQRKLLQEPNRLGSSTPRADTEIAEVRTLASVASRER